MEKLLVIIHHSVWPGSDLDKIVNLVSYAAGRWNAGERLRRVETWKHHIQVYLDRNMERIREQSPELWTAQGTDPDGFWIDSRNDAGRFELITVKPIEV